MIILCLGLLDGFIFFEFNMFGGVASELFFLRMCLTDGCGVLCHGDAIVNKLCFMCHDWLLLTISQIWNLSLNYSG